MHVPPLTKRQTALTSLTWFISSAMHTRGTGRRLACTLACTLAADGLPASRAAGVAGVAVETSVCSGHWPAEPGSLGLGPQNDDCPELIAGISARAVAGRPRLLGANSGRLRSLLAPLAASAAALTFLTLAGQTVRRAHQPGGALWPE